MEQYHMFISGRVQGVSFRAFVEEKSRNLDIKGFVRNLDDGRVEVLAQGEKENLEKLVEACEEGPSLAKVENIEIEKEKPEETYEGFKISF